MKILVASSAAVGIPILNHLLSRQEVIGVITAADKPKGRGRNLTPNDFSHFCESLELVIYKPNNHEELNSLLRELAPDLVVTVAYGRLIKPDELAIPKNGWLNVHFSLLPKWRGAAPVQYSILHGDSITGVTVFKLDEGMDTGPIYAQGKYEMQGDETTGSLLEKLSYLSLGALDEALAKIANHQPPTSQIESGASLAPKILKADGRLNWINDSASLERKIRALNPWPGAWTELTEKKLQILKARLAERIEISDPGRLIIDDGVFVVTKDGALELLEVKPEGRKSMRADEWARGLQNHKGLRFV